MRLQPGLFVAGFAVVAANLAPSRQHVVRVPAWCYMPQQARKYNTCLSRCCRIAALPLCQGSLSTQQCSRAPPATMQPAVGPHARCHATTTALATHTHATVTTAAAGFPGASYHTTPLPAQWPLPLTAVSTPHTSLPASQHTPCRTCHAVNNAPSRSLLLHRLRYPYSRQLVLENRGGLRPATLADFIRHTPRSGQQRVMLLFGAMQVPPETIRPQRIHYLAQCREQAACSEQLQRPCCWQQQQQQQLCPREVRAQACTSHYCWQTCSPAM